MNAGTVTSVLLLDSSEPVQVGGLTLTERAVLVADRIGLRPVRVVAAPDAAVRRSRRLVDVPVVWREPQAPLFEAVEPHETVLVVGPNVLMEPAALADLAARPAGESRPRVVFDRGLPLLAVLPPDQVASLRTCTSMEEIATRLGGEARADQPWPADRFCRAVDGPARARAERDYLRHTNGGSRESYFTKIIRRFSVPLSGRLARLGATPTQVTFGGLVLASASAWSIAQGSYAAGILGALLYYTSMVLDCSDGEVARLTVRDSPWGAWLETMVDYLTYFLLLPALVWASRTRPGADAYRAAALIALGGSLIVAGVATYLRHRVASIDPGQFDESSAQALASASRLHRFARWGRQWIKRSTMAHLVVVLALAGQLPLLLYLWAFGASLASAVILTVAPFVMRRTLVRPTRVQSDVRSF
jgi:phosphatidylglycerophosphate synthase